ncbi:MAG: glycosyltransferase family 4 protein [Candidatus Aminicenantes bacterium]|jgi:glycosyltransferase involved in cell wall biosynthesis
MKIFFILGGLRIGGYEILTARMANYLEKEGYKIGIVSLSNERAVMKLDLIDNKVKVYFTPRKNRFDVSALFKLRKLLNKEKPDLIFSCSFYELLFAKIAVLVLRTRFKFLLAFHFTVPFTRKDIMISRVYSLFDRFSTATPYIASHRSQPDFYIKRFHIGKGKFQVIHNGIDTRYFSPSKDKKFLKDGTMTLAHVASLKPLKDQITLLKAVVELNNRLDKWVLHVVGADVEGVLDDYKKIVEEKNIAGKVKFLGTVDSVKELLDRSDLFILTSRTEALPISVIEAISMGVPAIVTNVGGNPDIISDEIEGFLVEPGDYTMIAEKILFLYNNPAILREMGKNARKKAVTQFDFKYMMEQYLKLFKGMV